MVVYQFEKRLKNANKLWREFLQLSFQYPTLLFCLNKQYSCLSVFLS